MRSNSKKIGSHIRLVDERDRDQNINTLLGLTIDKTFIPSVANTIGSDMGNYKIIRKGQFACSLMQVRRDKKMPVALLTDVEEAIISQAYPVFEIADTDKLLPEYLMMWMTRSEFDREACFYAVGGVRGSLEWQDFCNMELPVPAPEKQREIVKQYYTIVGRISLNKQLNQKLEETAQAIHKQWFVDFEFPISSEYAAAIGKPELKGQPYKSSGGEMVFNEVLKQEIPKGWEDCLISDFGIIVTGKTPSSDDPHHFGSEVPFITPTDYPGYFIHVNGAARALSEAGVNGLKNKILPKGSILVTCIGSDMGKSVIARTKCVTNQQINSIVPDAAELTCYLFYHLKSKYEELRNLAIGSSTMLMINKTDFGRIKALKPSEYTLKLFADIATSLHDCIWFKECELKKLLELQATVLSGLASK